jgi:hypothetical protein
MNPNTGRGTKVATLNFGDVIPDVRGLAFSPGGVLFAINNTGPPGGANPDDLFAIDVGTGVGTLIGRTGFTGVQDLAFAPDGTLYGWDISAGLLTIDPLTGRVLDFKGGGTLDV